MNQRRHVLSTVLVLFVFALGACRQEPVEPALPVDDDAPITTDRERYTPEDSGGSVRYTIEATYINTTDESVYLAPCGYEPPSYYLERFDGEAWQTSTFSYPCPAVPAPAVEVAPGETFDATLTLDASRSPNAEPGFGTDLVPGVHRLVFAVVTGVDEVGFANDDLLPLEQRVSNAFELKEPQDEPVVGCPDVPWLAEFELYKTALTAPGTAELVVRTPDTAGPCGPGFSVEGVRFYADGALLGEGVPYRWWSSGAPEAFRHLWQLAPGEDGVPEAGRATFSLTAEVVVQNAQGETGVGRSRTDTESLAYAASLSKFCASNSVGLR